ncbi:MAG: thioredoxin domain-containing protein [Thermoplasmata archaeon]|jgi:protein-disulfide isomerase
MSDEDAPMLAVPVSSRDHAQGAENAPVTLLEYGDYECPYCGAAYPIVKELQRRLGAEVRFVFRNFPLANAHPHATMAAEAAEVVGAQGKFWEMHDLLYENQRALTEADLVSYAGRLGVAKEKFSTEIRRPVYADRVREDFASGVRSGVNGTPTFYINGIRHNGSYELEELQAAVESSGRGETGHKRPAAGSAHKRQRTIS